MEFAILVDYAEYKRMEETVKRLMPDRRMDLFFIKQHLIDKVKNTSVTGTNSLAGPMQQTSGAKKHLPSLSRRESSMLQFAENDRISYEVKIKLQNQVHYKTLLVSQDPKTSELVIGLVGSENHQTVIKAALKESEHNCLVDATLKTGDVWSIEFCNTYKMYQFL